MAFRPFFDLMISLVPNGWQAELLLWFEKNKRDLPWRQAKDPYKIWISEVLLQQTTSQAVIPYYRAFLKKFPNISALAKASCEEVFSLWAGIGYYKRAENLLLAGKKLKKRGRFPRNHKELLNLPGFGPYISRAVSSLAFGEPVGVLDGNVIRFLSRFYALPLKWWKAEDRAFLQKLSDSWVKNQKARDMNQALMEIGSLVCRSRQPLCLLCPLAKNCQALKKGLVTVLPLKKAKKPVEFWLWRPEKIRRGHRWAFIKNNHLPFLKGKWLFPGSARQLSGKAKNWSFKHSITHHQIFVRPSLMPFQKREAKQFHWLTREEVNYLNPSSLIKKVFEK